MAHCEPSSWADDIKSYRKSFGSQSYGAKGHEPVVERVPRTYGCPLGDTKHPNFSGGIPGLSNENPKIQARRFSLHGWNDTSLLKEGSTCEKDLAPKMEGRKRPEEVTTYSGQCNLFGIPQAQDQQMSDSWIGNSLIDPTKGKRGAQPPTDARGRKDLFDVLNGKNPGKPADDQWLGNKLINPAVGKFRPPGPEVNAGRRNLFGVMQQTGTDIGTGDVYREKLTDSWIGHRLIDPTKGKQKIDGGRASEAHLIASTFKGGYPKGWSDMKKPHARMVIPDHMKNEPTAQQAIAGFSSSTQEQKPMNNAAQGRCTTEGPRGNFYSLLQHTSAEAAVLQMNGAWDDSGLSRRRPIHPCPGEVHPFKGSDLLYWKPNDKAANFVKYGGLMQEQTSLSSHDPHE